MAFTKEPNPDELTADALCQILDEVLQLPQTVHFVDVYKSIATHMECWKMIFKGNGKAFHEVKANEHYIKAEGCLKELVEKLRNFQVSYEFISLFQQTNKREKLSELLKIKTFQSFEKIWKENEKLFKQSLDDTEVVQSVFTGILKYVPGANLPHDFHERKERVSLFQTNVRRKMLAVELKKEGSPKEIDELVSTSKLLLKIIHSRVFWNVGLNRIIKEFNGKLLVNTVSEIVESIRLLFEPERNYDEVAEHEKVTDNDQVNTFFDAILLVGSETFREQWQALMKKQDFAMSCCINMFKGANVPEEIQIAESFMSMKITDKVKVTLNRLGDLKKIESSVDAMKMSLKSCKIDDGEFLKAVESFELLTSGETSQYSFHDIGKSLETVFKIADPMSEDTLSVLETVGGASNLIDFLQKIVDEDIRNLIDAVDDISEQHVPETSVAALIEVKRFFQPILKSDLNGDANGLFELINKQVHSNPGFGRVMPVKIVECMSNLHNLISLYNNVANRSEQTKEKILNIVKKGKFQFNLNHHGINCDFSASYNVKKVKITHSKPALVDLRSRALLLANKQESKTGIKGNELILFVSFIDTCTDVSELIVTLHSTGHIKFKDFKQVEEAGNLLKLKQHLGFEYNNWCLNLNSVRSRYYLVNCLQGFQIHKLHTCLETREQSESIINYEREAETFLMAIHPNIQLVTLKKHYTNYKNHQTCDEHTFIDYIGQALHACLKNEKRFQRRLNCESVQGKKLEDVVKKGRLLVAQLDESSLLVVRTVLTLYYNTVQRLPEPNQILFCSKLTRWAEIELLLHRCLGASEFYGEEVLYCVTNVELLPNEVQFKLVEALRNLESDQCYLFAVICRGSKNHPFINELSEFLSKVRPLSDKIIEDILYRECPGVTTVTSDVAGLGKTTHLIQKAFSSGHSIATLHISGPMTKDRIVSGLVSLQIKEFNTLHIDIGPLASTLELDTFLFELIVLRFVSTSKTSVYLPTSSVSIEIANSLQDGLRKSLQTAILFQREHLEWQNYDKFVFSREVNSPVQVVCQYLLQLRQGSLDSFDIFFSGNNTVNHMPSESCKEILRMYFPSYPGISYTSINIFLNVLADQLKKLSISSFFRVSRIKDMLGQTTTPSIRSSLVTALVDVSKEFSSKSVDTCRAIQMSTMDFSSHLENAKPVSAAEGLTKIVKGMIRWEDSNHLMYVFHNQNIQTISPIYRDRTKVPSHIKSLFESQMKKEMHDYKKMAQSELQVVLQKICRSNPQMLPEQTLSKMSSEYALTPDNLLKMILIILRIKAGIPVLVMGETGCGKTSLIRYLAQICEVKFNVLNIHAGIEETAIIDTVLSCSSEALKNVTEQCWLFLDEINTSEYVGVISDVICHNNCNGQSLAPNLIVMGACNPYKLRSEKAISTAGLKGKIMTDELSRLVYRVLPLPEMLVDHVWDFGSLNETDENTYISRMVEGVFINDRKYHRLLSELLSMSQRFIRSLENGSCSVSLRDVQRCKTLTIWFMKILHRKGSKYNANIKKKAILLALAHCYHSRISDVSLRKTYRENIAETCVTNCVHFSENDVHDIIKREQEDILNRMDLPPGTAKNTALRENVFVLLVCILNRIPIFVVGKPGCSKSLSMQVIRNNLRGEDSKDEFFKTLPQLYCVCFQGSESSTSDGIIKVFEKAEKYQETNRADTVLSVVILDEIGLAEVSRFNPLKVLHNLLEPNGNDRPNVAVVGISNWSLDASKMNRAIHLSRPEMDEDELFETGISISDSFVSVDISTSKKGLSDQFSHHQDMPTFKTSLIENELRRIAESYYKYTGKLAFKNFHGLRDFYSLVKFFAKEVSRNPEISIKEKRLIMMTGIERNFGGLPAERPALLSVFQVKDMEQSCPVIGLIKSNIDDPLARHLMLITNGESVLGILEQNLSDFGRQNREVIFGSQFEEDLTDDYNYRILNRIILCMEQGLVLILKDLENIYGSLYDMLNQNYTIIGKKKNCRVALGPYSNPICHVDDNFRCIVLVDDSKLQYSDPPFLNRFEKQYLRFSDIISPEQKAIITKLEKWVFEVSVYKDFDALDAFPIFSEDMVSSLILHKYRGNLTEDEIIYNCKLALLWIIKPEVIVRLSRNSYDTLSQAFEKITECYLDLPVHRGIIGLLELQLQRKETLDCLMSIVFTNSNIHTKVLQKVDNFKIQVEKLGAFKSEKQLSSRMKAFWLESNSEILFLQCSAFGDERHIMLAKSAIEKFRQEFISTRSEGDVKHVYLVVHLDRSKRSSNILSQINFLSNWKLITLDSLEEPKSTLPELCIQSLLEAVMAKRPLNDYIKEQLFWSFTRIKYKQDGRNVESLTALMNKMKHSEDFLGTMDTLIVSSITKFFPDMDDKDWQLRVACKRQSLQTASSFIGALEAYILESISVLLVKYVFVMETEHMLDTYFIDDEYCAERIEIWKTIISQEERFSIVELPYYSGPESYVCNAYAVELKMPFSKYFFDSVETTSEEYLYSVKLLKSACGLDPEDTLPDEILFELQKKQELIVDQKLPRLMQYDYASAMEDYFDDFCNIMSVQICPSLLVSDRIQFTKLIAGENISFEGKDLLEGITSLHIAIWNHVSAFSSYLQLFETCRELLTPSDLQKLTLKHHTTQVLPGHVPGDQIEIDKCVNNGQDKEGLINLHDLYETAKPEKAYEDEEDIEIVEDQESFTSENDNVETHDDNVTQQDFVGSYSDVIEDAEMPSTLGCVYEASEIAFAISLDKTVNKVGLKVSPQLILPIVELEASNKEHKTYINLELENNYLQLFESNQSEQLILSPSDVKLMVCQEHEKEFGELTESSDEKCLTDHGLGMESLEGETCIGQKDERVAECSQDAGNLDDVDNDDETNQSEPLVSYPSEIEEMVHQEKQKMFGELIELSDEDSLTDVAFGKDTPREISYLDQKEVHVAKSLDGLIDDTENRGFEETFSMTEKEEETELKDILVEIVCQKMLPTQATIEHYSSMKQWLMKTNEVLFLVAQVHPGSKFIHHLRISADIVSSLVLQSKLDITLLYTFAYSVQSEQSLDSNNVLNALMTIIEQTAIHSSAKCQRILASYFLRCLLSDPESKAIFGLLDLACLPDTNVAAFKPVLSIALECEQEDDQDFLFQILKDGVVCEMTEGDSMGGNGFILKLNAAIKYLHTNGRSQCQFMVLIVDLIEDIIYLHISKLDHKSEEFTDLLKYLIGSQTALIGHSFDLQYVVASSFFKAFVKHLTHDLSSADKKVADHVNALLTRKADNGGIVFTIESYVLKCLFQEKSRSCIKKDTEGLTDVLPNLSNIHIPVTDALRDASIDRCPLLMFISSAKQKDAVLLRGQSDVEFTSGIKSLIDEIHTREGGLFLLFAYAEMTFYIPRSYQVLDDKIKSDAHAIAKHVQKSSLDRQYSHFLQCLLGTEDFKIVYLSQSEQSSTSDILLNSFLISFFSSCLVTGYKQEYKTFFLDFLQSPCSVENVFLPGYPGVDEGEKGEFYSKPLHSKLKKLTDCRIANCECQHRVVIVPPFVEDITCPACLNILHVENHLETKKKSEVECTGFTKGRIKDRLYTVRNLSPLACQIIFLLIKGCLIGSLALDYETPVHLEKLLRLPTLDIDIPETLWTDIKIHWENIGKLLGTGEYTVGIFLQTVLLHTQDFVFGKCDKMCSASDRLLWENEFERRLQIVVENRFVYHRQMVKHYRLLSNQSNMLEDVLFEVDENTEGSMSTIFRQKSTPSYDNFVSELFPMREGFPLLCLIMSLEEELHLPAHIKPIMQWHMAVVSTANYAMRKHECLNMTVTDFFQQAGGNEKTVILRTLFGQMQKSWSYLRQHLNRDIAKFMMNMHCDLKMEDCIMYSTDCVLYRLLKYLVDLQNKILDDILVLSESCESVHFLMRSETMSMIPYVNIADVSQMHLLQFKDSEFDWVKVIEKYSLCDTTYGQGQKIWYDFESIEKLLVRKLVPGKAYVIISSLPQIVFTDELYKNYVALSNDIKTKVKQKPLSPDILNAIEEKQKNDPRICRELLIQVGMIMTLLNKTGGDPDKCFSDYVEEVKNILTKKFSDDLLPNPTSAIKLGNIVALYETLEEINAETLIDALDDEYRCELDFDQKTLYETMVKTNKWLGNCVLRACKRFINRCLSLREADASRPLLDYVREESFWPDGVHVGAHLKVGEVEERLQDVIPTTVMVKHIYYLVNFIETKIEKLRAESMNMSKMATSWQNNQKHVPLTTYAKKKKAVTKHINNF